MNIRELYSGELFQEAFKRLQEIRIHKGASETQRFITKIEGPEVLSDNLLINWLALNYLWAVDFKADKSLIIGEIGGVIPTHPQNGKQVLAFAKASLSKVIYGIEKVKEAEKTGDKTIISGLEKEIEMPLEYRHNITVVNGNKNIAHYDFTSGAARENPLELLSTNISLLLSAEGFIVLSNKCLRGEQYIFNVPVNQHLFDRLQPVEELDEKLDIVRYQKESLIPEDFIAGFHIIYKGKEVIVIPVIPERDLEPNLAWLKDKGFEPSQSNISYLGDSDPYGRFGVMEKGIIE